MKIYRLELKIGSSEPKIYKVKANSIDEAKDKLQKSISIKYISTIDDIDYFKEATDLLDMIKGAIKSK